jgi:hypothetical protein
LDEVQMSAITPKKDKSRHEGFRDSGDFGPVAELQEIKHRVENVLRSLNGNQASADAPLLPEFQIGQATEKSVREVIRARANRVKCFKADLFADPAWDMLLELYAAQLGSKKISVSSLCIAASVPATTALRWMNILEREGLVVRRSDPKDGRRTFVHLSSVGLAGMNTFFGSIEVHRQSVGH